MHLNVSTLRANNFVSLQIYIAILLPVIKFILKKPGNTLFHEHVYGFFQHVHSHLIWIYIGLFLVRNNLVTFKVNNADPDQQVLADLDLHCWFVGNSHIQWSKWLIELHTAHLFTSQSFIHIH